ncbi:MAG: DUF3806 domain-containing protein, partial [Bacteroidaceae bacterium]|nr:DUF3806 domain-containing protein [Bacteroidaceae bacterium]
TVIEGRFEYPALQFGDLIVNPATLVWNKIKQKQPCNLKVEYEAIKKQVEERMNP